MEDRRENKARVRLVAFDVDGTLTENKSSWEFVHRKLGIWEDVGERYLNMFRAGEITYQEFARLDALRWKGIEEERLLTVLEEISYLPGAVETLGVLKETGLEVALISSGILPLVRRVARDLGVNYYVANELLAEEGVLTGEVRVKVSMDVQELSKGAHLEKLSQQLGIGLEETAAVGDGIGDLDMFHQAGTPLLVNCTGEDREVILKSMGGRKVLELSCISRVPQALGLKAGE